MSKTITKQKLHILTGVHKKYRKSDDGNPETLSTIIFEPKSFTRKRDDNAGALLYIKGKIQMKKHSTGDIYSAKTLVINEDRYKSIRNELLSQGIAKDTQHLRYIFEIISTYNATEVDNYQIRIKASYEYIETQSLFDN